MSFSVARKRAYVQLITPPPANSVVIYNESRNISAVSGDEGQILSVFEGALSFIDNAGGDASIDLPFEYPTDTVNQEFNTTTSVTDASITITLPNASTASVFFVTTTVIGKNDQTPMLTVGYKINKLFKYDASSNLTANPFDDRIVFENDVGDNDPTIDGGTFDAKLYTDGTDLILAVKQPASSYGNWSWKEGTTYLTY